MKKTTFNFTANIKEDCVNLCALHDNEVPLYIKELGYGFVDKTSGLNKRKISLDHIVLSKEGCIIKENDNVGYWDNFNNYNYGGLVFRIDIKVPGAYLLEVTTTSNKQNTWVSVSGMQAERLISTTPWDAAERITKENLAKWKKNTWCYKYVTGSNFIEIEVEPLLMTDKEPESMNLEVGIAEITITKLANQNRKENEKPTIFTLGDSTVKSYIFEEAGMSGWGQVFDDLFDLEKVNVINYSQGGRSFKSMYCEGRFNEVLMKGKAGDYILVQSGHNDEATGSEAGPTARFGRGSDSKSYEAWIKEVYIPSIQSRGMIPILITPMTRINGNKTREGNIELNGFKNSNNPGIDFPGIMKKAGEELRVPVINLYEESIQYIYEIGGDAAAAMFLSLEAGEVPSKTNSGSYANGNPSGSSDGTHYKETLSKQWARIIVSESYKQHLEFSIYLKPMVKNAIISGDFSEVYKEIPKDVEKGENAYYRNQIEKLIKLGVFHADEENNFYPKAAITTKEFIMALNKLWDICLYEHEIAEKGNCEKHFKNNYRYTTYDLSREIMGCILFDAYLLKFGKDENGYYKKPKYMTDYNGTNLSPEDANYDPNLVGESATYYPLTPWNKITDLSELSEQYRRKIEEAYKLGLIRCEDGIERGKMTNGSKFLPKQIVTREKAAKALYFMWVLIKDIKEENDK